MLKNIFVGLTEKQARRKWHKIFKKYKNIGQYCDSESAKNYYHTIVVGGICPVEDEDPTWENVIKSIEENQ